MQPSRPWSARLAPAVLFLGVVALYLPSLGNGFVHDDHEVIVRQPRPAGPGDLLRVFAEPHFRGLPYYRPVTRATLLAQHGLHGARPAPFRLGNALLMGAAALLAFALLRSPGLGVTRGPALLAAGLFAAHPAASSCVYPIASGRETLLPAVLMLAATAAWLRGRRAAAWASFTLALFAKEQAVVVPLLFGLADGLGLGGPRPSRPGGWLARYAPVVPIAALYAVPRVLLFGGSEYDLALLERPLGPLLSLAYAIQTTIAPFASLVYEPELHVWRSPGRLLLSLAVLAALGLTAHRVRTPPGRVVAFWLGWFVLVQLPTLNWLEQEARFAERYVFLASLGLFAIAAGVASTPGWTPRARRVGTALGLVLLAAAATTSLGRAASFHDDVTFARRWLATDPDSPDAHHLLGVNLVLAGRPEAALPHYRAALRASPDSADLHHNLGTALAMLGRDAEARTELREALALDPGHPEARLNLGRLLAREGREEEALASFRAALRADPDSAGAHESLGVLLARRGELEAAAPHLARAVRLRPDDGEAWRNLGVLELQRGRRAAAAEAFRAALRLDPGDAAARRQLGLMEKAATP